MSSSGLIYAVIVGAWAAYLVPMWLRRQDELNEARPTERFSTAIRLLSGRAAMERKYAKGREEAEPEPAAVSQPGPEPDAPGEPGAPVDPDRPGGPVDPGGQGALVDVRALAIPATEVKPAAPRPRTRPVTPRAARARVLARRRRTTSMLFLAFTAGMIAAAVGGLGFLWAPAVPAAMLTGYIGHLRRQERRRFEVKLDHRRAAEAAQRLRERPPAPRPDTARGRPAGHPGAGHGRAGAHPGGGQGRAAGQPGGGQGRGAAQPGGQGRAAGHPGAGLGRAAAHPGGAQGRPPAHPDTGPGRPAHPGTSPGRPAAPETGNPPHAAHPPAPTSAPAPASAPEAPATADRRALVEQTDHAEWVDQQREQHTAPADESWASPPVPSPTVVTAPVTRRRPADRSRTPLYDQQTPHPDTDLDRPRAANE